MANITTAKIVGDWRRIVADQIVSHENTDIGDVGIHGTVTLSPVWAKGAPQGLVADPSAFYTVQTVVCRVRYGQLYDQTNTTPYEEVIVEIDDHPIVWDAKFDLAFRAQPGIPEQPIQARNVQFDSSAILAGQISITGLLPAAAIPDAYKSFLVSAQESANAADAAHAAAAAAQLVAEGARDTASAKAQAAAASVTLAGEEADRATAQVGLAASEADRAIGLATASDQAVADTVVAGGPTTAALNATYVDQHRDIRPSLFTYEAKMELFRTVEFQDATGVYAVQQISGSGLPMLDHSADWGKTWTTLGQLPCGPSSVVRLTSGTFLVFEATAPAQPDQNPRVFRSADNGATWTHVHTMQFPPFVHGAGVCEGTDGSVIVTEYGNVNNKNYRAYRSTDDGQTYTVTLESPLVASGGDVGHIHSVVYDPYEQCHVLFMDLANTATAGPRIYRSDDNGATWTLIGEATGANTPNWVMPMFFPDYIAWGTDNERNGLIGRISRADFYAGNLTATQDVAIINLKSIYYSFPIREGVWIITVASETIMPQWAPGSPGNWGHEVYVVSNNGGTVTAGFSHLPPSTDLGVLSNQKPFTPGYRFDALDHDGMTYVNLHTQRPRTTGALPVSQDWQGPNMNPVDGWGTTQPIIANRLHLGFRTTTGAVANALSVNQFDDLVYTREDVALASRPEIIMKPSTGIIQFRQGGTNAAYIENKKFILFNTLWLAPNGVSVSAGSGSPEGVVTAPPGSLFVNWAAQRGTGLWVKGGGTGNAGWEPAGAPSGSTSTRPAAPVVGVSYFDTTLGKPIWWTGTAWVDATGTAV